MSWIAQRPPLFSQFFHIFYGLCSCWTLSYISRSEQPRGIHVPSTWLRPLSYLISFFVVSKSQSRVPIRSPDYMVRARALISSFSIYRTLSSLLAPISTSWSLRAR